MTAAVEVAGADVAALDAAAVALEGLACDARLLFGGGAIHAEHARAVRSLAARARTAVVELTEETVS